jgi:hypothetical protein
VLGAFPLALILARTFDRFFLRHNPSVQFRRDAVGWLSLALLRRSQEERYGLEMRTPSMKTVTLTFQELFLLAGTRTILGEGVALLVAKRLNDPQRETAGVVLTAIGLLTTVPRALEILGKANAPMSSPPIPLRSVTAAWPVGKHTARRD